MTACFWVKNILTDQWQKNTEIPNSKEEVFVPYKHQTQKSILVISIIEFRQKLCFPGFFSFLKVSHDMCWLLPQVMSFFKLHFTLRKKENIQVKDKSDKQWNHQTFNPSINQTIYYSISQSVFTCMSDHPLVSQFIGSSVPPFICSSVNQQRKTSQIWDLLPRSF